MRVVQQWRKRSERRRRREKEGGGGLSFCWLIEGLRNRGQHTHRDREGGRERGGL